MKIKMKLEKETPGALRYQELGDNDQVVKTNEPDCVIGTLYLRKRGIAHVAKGHGSWPRFIQVDVTIEEES